MQDASLAEKQGLLAVFPNAIIIMCYFHVKKNVKDNFGKYGVSMENRELINNDVSWLHDSRFLEEYDFRVNIAINHWNSLGLHQFVNYFTQQWLSPPFNFRDFSGYPREISEIKFRSISKDKF